MSTNLYTSYCSSSSSNSLMELSTRERDKTNENDYIKSMRTYLPSKSLFNAELYHVTCATCLKIAGNYDEDEHGYLELQPFIFTVYFPSHSDYLDSQKQIKKKQMNKQKKFVNTSTIWTASGSTRTAEPINEQLVRLQPMMTDVNLYNRCMIRPSHQLIHRNRDSNTFSIRTHKRLRRLRRRYNRYLMSRFFLQYLAQSCHIYCTEIDYHNERFQQCQKYAYCDSHDSMPLYKYKMSNKKRVADGKRNPDITVLCVRSETRSKLSKSCACTPSGYAPTDCDRDKCFVRNKCCDSNRFHQLSDKYKRMNKKRVTNKKLRDKGELSTDVLYDGSKSRYKSLQSFERSSGIHVPTDCDPYECYQKFIKIIPYGCNVSTQSGNYIITNVKQENIKKSTAKSVRKTAYASSGTKLNSSQPIRRSTGFKISINCDPNECLQHVKKYTPYGCHASTQLSKYEMLNEKRDTVKPSSTKRGTDTAVPGVAARSKRNAKRPDVGVTVNYDTNECFPQEKKYMYYGSHVSIQSSRYNMQEQQSSRREAYGEKQSEEKKKNLKPFQCEPDTWVSRESVIGATKTSQQANKITDTENIKANQKNKKKQQRDSVPGNFAPLNRNACQRLKRLQQTLKRIYCKPGDCDSGKCEPKNCYQRFQPTRFDIINAYSTSRNSQGSTQTFKDKAPYLRSLKDTKEVASTTPRHMPNYQQAVRIGSTCSLDVEFYKGITQNGTTFQQLGKKPNPDKLPKKQSKIKKSCRKKLNPYECKVGMCVPRKQFDSKPGVCIPGKCDLTKFYQLLTSNISSNVTSRSGEKKKEGRKATGGTSILHKSTDASGMTKHRMHTPNRQAGRNTSKRRFHVGFYKGRSQNVFLMNGIPSTQRRQVINPYECNSGNSEPGKYDPAACKQLELEQFNCEHGVCAPGKCNNSKCFQQMKVTDADRDSNASSRGSEASIPPKHTKKRLLVKRENATIYNNKGSFRMPRPNVTLQIFHTQVVGIGSKCSCNVEFYKGLPQNGFGMSDQIYELASPDQVNKSEQQDKKTSSLKTRQSNPFECIPGSCVSGKCNPSACVHRAIDRLDCARGVCVPGKCDPIKCFERIKVSGTDTESVGSQASMSKTRMKNGRLQKEENSMLYKDKGFGTTPRPKMPLHIANRQAVSIGSKCSFNVEFYKSLPQNGFVMSENINEPANYYDQSNTPTKRKTGSSRKTREERNPFECKSGVCKPGKCDPATCAHQILKQLDCDRGVCVPGKCDPIKCFERIKVSGTDTESVGSQASMSKTRVKKGRLQKEENATLYKNKGFGTTPRPKMPLHIANRQAVRIGSKCSFNVEFYKSLPQNGFVTRENVNEPANFYDQSNTPTKRKTGSSRKTRKERNPFECEPGICKPDKCEPATCAHQILKELDCDRGVCVPGKCDPIKCFERIKVSGTDTESVGSQASMSKTRVKKGRLQKEENATLYKNKGFSTTPRLKMPLHIANRQAVRIGSKCSFNVEFYKSLPQNGFVTRENVNEPANYYDQSNTPTKRKTGSSRKTRKERNPFECEPGVCKPGKCDPATCAHQILKQLDCDRGVCDPGKCDPIKCFERIKVSGTDTESVGSQASMSKTRMKKGRLQKEENSILYKDKGFGTTLRTKMPLHIANRQAVHIGSKCSFNMEFYKSLPQNGFVTSEQSNESSKYDLEDTSTQHKGNNRNKNLVLKPYEYQPGVCVPRKCDPYKCLQQTLNRSECDSGVCVPGKCNVTDCFQRLKASGTDTNVTSHGNQASSNASRKNKGSKRNQGKKFRYKDTSLSATWKPKMPTLKPRQRTVRIDSGLNFNVELFKSLPPNGVVRSAHSNLPAKYAQGDTPTQHKASSQKKKRVLKPYECQPGVCVPRTCDPYKCLQQTLNRSECDPGVCVPGKCNVNDCVQRLKASDTDTNTSNAMSRGSLASSKTGRRKKRRDLPQGNGIISKDASAISMSRPTMLLHKPRHTVRIGSTLSFNVEFYKSLPPKGVTTSINMNGPVKYNQNDIPTRPDKTNRLKGQVLNPFECKPGICVPGKCDPGVCAKHKVTELECQPGVYIPGKCDPGSGLQNALLGFECQPGVCIPGKCDVSKCFQRLNISGTETTDSNATSRGSQAYAKTGRKKKGLKQNQENGFRYKDKGAYSMRVPKMRVPRNQLVRIGSKCSFNIEFYKTLPQNNFVRNISALFDQGDTPRRKNGQELNPFECKPGICVPGKCEPRVCAKHGLTGFECQPGLCVPGKCDVAKCFEQLKNNTTGTSKKKKSKLTKLFECEPGVCLPGKCDPYECLARLKIIHGGSAYSDDGQAFTQTMKGKKVNRKNIAGKETLYKEKGASTIPRNKMPLHMPNRDVVRIGSKCSFNVEFYKEKPNNLKALSQIECESGVCIPKKCDPIDCYQRLQNAGMGINRGVDKTRREVVGTKRKVKGTKRKVMGKLGAKKTKRGGDEETKSESEGPKRTVKKSKREAKKTKRGIQETSPTQSIKDNSDQESSSPSQSSLAKPTRKGIKRKRKQKKKPKPDAGSYDIIDDSQESITIEQTTDIKDESQTLKPSKPKPKNQSKKKIKKEPKRYQNEQSYEQLDSAEDAVDAPPRVEWPKKSYSTNAGTQSRKYPDRDIMPRIKPPVKKNICDCGAKILPPLADRIFGCIGRMLRARKEKAIEGDYDILVIEPNDYCMDDVNNYCEEDVEEIGVVIGSCGGFNLKLTKNETKAKNF